MFVVNQVLVFSDVHIRCQKEYGTCLSYVAYNQ